MKILGKKIKKKKVVKIIWFVFIITAALALVLTSILPTLSFIFQ